MGEEQAHRGSVGSLTGGNPVGFQSSCGAGEGCRVGDHRSGAGGGPMNDAGMTPEDEHEFYSRPENQVPRGHARRRSLLRRSGYRVAAAVRSRKRPRDQNPG